MSRTYRRQRASYNLDWVLRKTVWSNRFFDSYLEPDSSEGMKALARYFSDAGCGSFGNGTAPHWYRRYLNHKVDRREEKQLIRCLKNSTESDLVFLPRVRDASYFW